MGTRENAKGEATCESGKESKSQAKGESTLGSKDENIKIKPQKPVGARDKQHSMRSNWRLEHCGNGEDTTRDSKGKGKGSGKTRDEKVKKGEEKRKKGDEEHGERGEQSADSRREIHAMGGLSRTQTQPSIHFIRARLDPPLLFLSLSLIPQPFDT
jgi:hypothetical protein